MASIKPLKLPLAAAEVDRAAHLRSDETYLSNAFADGQVLIFFDEKFAVVENQVLFLKGSTLDGYQSQTDYF